MKWLITPAFCKSKMLESCLEHLHTDLPSDVKHVIIDNHYPINKEQNQVDIYALVKKFRCLYIDSGKDLGLHHGLNNAYRIINPEPSDTWVQVDPDDRPSPGFYDALNEVMCNTQKLALCALSFDLIKERLKEHASPEIERFVSFAEPFGLSGGTTSVWIHPKIEMLLSNAINLKFIESVGGFYEYYPYYGGFEASMYERWNPLGYELGFLLDYVADSIKLDPNDTTLFDPEYRLWKDAHLSGYEKSFEEWLQETNRGHLIEGGVGTH